MRWIKSLHYWFGFVGIIVFLLTGQYMDHYYDHLEGITDGSRMLFRSAHIYILISSLVNLCIGVYFEPSIMRHPRVLQYVISLALFVAPILLCIGFFIEPHLGELERPYSRIGLYLIFGISLLLIWIGWFKKK